MALAIFNQHHQEGPLAIDMAATALVEQVTSSAKPEDAWYQVFWDILEFGADNPRSIDFALHVFNRAAALLPDTFQNCYGTGERAARIGMGWFLKEQVRALNPYELPPTEVGESAGPPRDDDFPGPEYANVAFLRGEVAGPDARLDLALQKTLRLQRERRRTVAALAVYGRASALRAFPGARGRHSDVAARLSGVLGPASLGRGVVPPWSKCDFVACCVAARATMRTVLEDCAAEDEEWRDGRVRCWRDGLAEFLLDRDQAADDKNREFRDGDYLVKYHAAVGILWLPLSFVLSTQAFELTLDPCPS